MLDVEKNTIDFFAEISTELGAPRMLSVETGGIIFGLDLDPNTTRQIYPRALYKVVNSNVVVVINF